MVKDQPLLMILDDYHEIQNSQIHQIMQAMVDFLPPKTHIIITTRQDPPLSLPRWRARSWLSDITAIDLRFDQSEAGNFLKRTMQIDLKPEAVALLGKQTEGWVAGLQLAALSLEDTDFSSETIQQFGGRDRYVASYLMAEVLDHQSAEIQQFLISIATLDRFNAQVCTAILHPEPLQDTVKLTRKYQDLILTLERSNLFIIPLDREGYWYRFHHLFVQLLRQRLEQMWSPQDICQLYRRAAQWLADRGFIEEAVNYAVQGEDYAFTAQLISEFEVDNLWNQTREWGAFIPAQILREYPKATIHIAFAHMIRNEIKETVRYVELVRKDPQVEAEILLIDSIFIRNKGDIFQALNLAIRSAELLKPVNQPKYFAAQSQVVVCMWRLGDLSGAEKIATSLQHEINISSGQSLNIYIQLIHISGMIKEQRGQLVEAERIYLDGIETIEQSGTTMPLIGLLEAKLAGIHYQWNDIENAMILCESGRVWGQRTGIGDIIIHSLFVQVDLAIYHQDEKAVQESIDGFYNLLDWAEFSDIGATIQANQAVYYTRLGNLAPAIRWADSSGLSLEDHPTLKNQVEYQSLVRVRYEEIRHLGIKDHSQQILGLVDMLILLSENHEFVDLAIYYRLLKALLLDLNNQGKDAIAALNKALDLAYPGGFMRVFIDLGAPMRDLIQKSLAYEPHMIYKRRLLLAFRDERIEQKTSVSSSHEIMIQLTPREFEILHLIAAGLSNKAIQENLMLSKNTVRTHIKNLYSKLGVHSRTQAIQQAQKNGLI
jgi:LuxR family maltose regulon positive regulatory protein